MDELQLSPISSKKITKPGKPTAKPFSDIVKGVQNFGFHFDSILISPKVKLVFAKYINKILRGF